MSIDIYHETSKGAINEKTRQHSDSMTESK